MTRTRVVGIALLAVTGLALAAPPQDRPTRPSAGFAGEATNNDVTSAAAASDPTRLTRHYRRPATIDGQLRPRRTLPRTATAGLNMPGEPTGRLIVKFNDDVKGRVDAGGTLLSRNDRDMGSVAEILQRYGARMRPVFRKSQERLEAIERRAADLSGFAQPDLAGMVYVITPDGAFMNVAHALNELDIIEFVEVEPRRTQAQAEGPTGACCLEGNACLPNVTAAFCITQGNGFYQGDGTTCGGDCGTCCDIANDNACNENVSPDRCAIVIGGVFLGNLPCGPDDPCADLGTPQCGAKVAGSCFIPSATPFCDDEALCDDVCEVDPYCCDGNQLWERRGLGQWDMWCCDHALELSGTGCFGGPNPVAPPNHAVNAPTTNLADAQGYLTQAGYSDPPNANIASALRWELNPIIPPANVMDGYTGEGWDLDSLWNIGVALATPPPNGPGLGPNRTRGWGIRIAVLDDSAFVSTAVGVNQPYLHEDLTNVVPEEKDESIPPDGIPDQTVIVTPLLPSLTGHHGTALLGIIGAVDQTAAGVIRLPGTTSPATSIADQRGMVGIAPEAELFYYPTTTQQEPAGRIVDAIVSATEDLVPGDIMVLGQTLGLACATVLSSQSVWNVVRLATDLGITVCAPAGDLDGGGCDLGENGQAGDPEDDIFDSGAMVVGAVYPGCDWIDGVIIDNGTFGFNCYCRKGFSNFCTGCNDASRVQISAWGEAVATTGGGGNLYTGNDLGSGGATLNRTYTNSFTGTSAAVAQVAALTACMQGFALQFFNDGTVLSPGQIRAVMVTGDVPGSDLPNFDTGIGQCGFEDPANVPGRGANPAVNPCGFMGNYWGDWDIGGTILRVGAGNSNPVGNEVYTSTVAAADMITTFPWFDDNPGLVAFEVLTGEYLSGTILSLAAIDGNFLYIASELSTPSTPGFDSRNSLAGGKITDVMVTLNFAGQNISSTMEITTSSQVTGGNGIMLVFLYGFDHAQWIIGGVSFLQSGDPVLGSQHFLFANGQQFIDPSTGEMLVRLWTVSLGLGPDYQTLHDYLKVELAGNPFISAP